MDLVVGNTSSSGGDSLSSCSSVMNWRRQSTLICAARASFSASASATLPDVKRREEATRERLFSCSSTRLRSAALSQRTHRIRFLSRLLPTLDALELVLHPRAQHHSNVHNTRTGGQERRCCPPPKPPRTPSRRRSRARTPSRTTSRPTSDD